MPSDSAPILVVDDNIATRYAVRRVLERHRYIVEEAGTGTDGLRMLAERDYGALVLDVNLPDMSGFDVVRQLRDDPRTHLLPVVHVSAAAVSNHDLITGLDAGADAYLIHPVDPDVLLATLRTLLRVRRAEDALRDVEARFREIFEHVGAPIAVVDASLQVHEANHAFRRLVGQVEGPDALQRAFHDQIPALKQMAAAVKERRRWSGTFRVEVPGSGGGTRMTEWRVAPYRAPDVGLLFIEDTTDQHARERTHREELATANTELAEQIAARERTEEELLQAQKMDALGKLTGGIAHDFNNLLTSILSGLDMIGMSINNGKLEKVPRYLDVAASSANRAAALTQRMLAFARKQSLDARAFDVRERAGSLEDMLRRSIGENIELEFQLGEQPLVAVADPVQFESVMLNLVINARDALQGHGLIRIRAEQHRCRNEPPLADGDYISVKVIDNGQGIDPMVLHKVFEPFFTTKPQGQGTGLGLSMTYGFARQSGGTARVLSEPGLGTELEILLPAGVLAEEAIEPVAAPRVSSSRSARILLVDDTDNVRLMVREMLAEAGFQIIEASNAQDALYELQSDPDIDLLLTDVGLPGMDGRALADAARRLRADLPVLFATGYAESALRRQEFLDEGMALLLKPFSMDELLRHVRAILEARAVH